MAAAQANQKIEMIMQTQKLMNEARWLTAQVITLILSLTVASLINKGYRLSPLFVDNITCRHVTWFLAVQLPNKLCGITDMLYLGSRIIDSKNFCNPVFLLVSQKFAPVQNTNNTVRRSKEVTYIYCIYMYTVDFIYIFF